MGFECDHRGFGGLRGRNVANFLGDLNQTHIFQQQEKFDPCALSRPNFMLFSNFMMIFAHIISIFVGLEIFLKIGFP